jgi:hypothetical protein
MTDETIDSGPISMQPPKKKPGPKPENRRVLIEKEHVVCGWDNIPVDPDRVYDMALHGCKDTEIAGSLGIDDVTLRYNFSDILRKARENMKDRLRRAQMRVAIETGNPTMLIWLGKNELKQSDNPTVTQETILPWSDED